jgi:hypothetical protein
MAYDNLDLGGFEYGRWDAIDEVPAPRGWQLTVLEHAHGSGRSVETYERLAAVLRAAGDEQTARRALARRERRVTTQQRMTLHDRARFPRLAASAYTVRRRLYDAVVGYGYGEAGAFLSLVLVFLAALTHYAAGHDDIRARVAGPTCVAVPRRCARP